MSFVSGNAAVAYSLMTSGSGTSEQLWQVSSTGTSAGVTAGNFYLDSPSSNLLNGRKFTVNVGGWVKAHGATQTMKFNIQIFPWNTTVSGGRTTSGTDTFTLSGFSGTLTAGTYYDFLITQDFFGEANANTLTCFTPTLYFAGSSQTISSAASAQTVAFASASQTEPINGVNSTTDYPLCSFVPTFTNSVSDTTETMQLTQASITTI